MCGRYALGVVSLIAGILQAVFPHRIPEEWSQLTPDLQRLAYIQRQLQEHGMQVDEAPDDDDVRETYNFAPGSFGAIYRAEISEEQTRSKEDTEPGQEQAEDAPEQVVQEKKDDHTPLAVHPKYKLQSMKWGLIPFWTKRQPDYGSMMRTINCRDDSLIENRGMWTTMKQRKRCIVICQGFYEWLKKGPGGKEKVPHFVRRKDGDLMCFAGLWDWVKYEDSDEKLYTYTVITTSSNSYLKFLHDRMPVILDYGSEEMKTWLDPTRKTWSKELQSILKPYEGELECYPVSKEVGKVGNNSPDFIIPVSSKENKSNIANFFANAKAKDVSPKKEPGTKVEEDEEKMNLATHGIKREHTPEIKVPENESKKQKLHQGSVAPSPQKPKTRSATHNTPMRKASKPSDGSQRITNFFKK